MNKLSQMSSKELVKLIADANNELENRTGLYILLVDDIEENRINCPVSLSKIVNYNSHVADFDTILKRKQDMENMFPHATYTMFKLNKV